VISSAHPALVWTNRPLRPVGADGANAGGAFDVAVGDGLNPVQFVDLVEERFVNDRPRWRPVYVDAGLQNDLLDCRECFMQLTLTGEMPPASMRVKVTYDSRRDRYVVESLD
jgi:hypothetical protein